MALSQSVLSELLDVFRSGEGVDLVRDAVRSVMQQLMRSKRPSRSAPPATNAPTPGSLNATVLDPGC